MRRGDKVVKPPQGRGCVSGAVSIGIFLFLSLFFFSLYLFYFWLCWVLVAACSFFIAAHELLSNCGTWIPDHGLRSCGMEAQLPLSM